MTHKTVTDNGSEDMPPHIMRRGNRLHYNRAYPLDVQGKLGSAPFRRSLHTDSLREAVRSLSDMDREFHRRVDEARLTIAREGNRPAVSNRDAESLAAQSFRESLSTAEEMFTPPASPAALDRAIEDADNAIADARRQLGEQDFGPLRDAAKAMAEGAGFNVEDGRGLQCLLRLVARARLAVAEVYRGRLLGRYDVRPGDPFFASLMASPRAAAVTPPQGQSEVPPSYTVADLIKAYREDKVDSTAPSTQRAYQPVFRFLREAVGERKNLASIDRVEGRRMFDLIQKLPSGIGKQAALKGLSVPDAIAEAARRSLPPISAKTINASYMTFLSAMFGWAVREGWMANNPVAGLRVAEAVAPDGKRAPFTMEQLRAIFSEPPWSPRDAAGAGDPARYWGPIVALYHGFRVGEIAQLTPQDVEKVEGVWIVRVQGERLKTANSRRRVPIHPELQRLGFLRFVERQRAAGAAYLFPLQGPNSREQWGQPLSRWFVRFLKNQGIEGQRLGMHSFRHNFQDR